jgi:biopolymer transport protein ExbD
MKTVRKKKSLDDLVELDITAFLNLMVVLVPFLLITAVFSKMSILELHLPALDAIAKEDEQVKLQLQVVVRPDILHIQDGNLGLIKSVDYDLAGKTDWESFSNILVEIKSRFPEEKNISLLLDKNVKYKTVIELMDHVKSAEVLQVTTVEKVELFPNVSVGVAPEEQAQQPDTRQPESEVPQPQVSQP